MPDCYSIDNLPPVVACCSGEAVYDYEYEKDGKIVKEVWQIDDYIQSFADKCTVESIIKRYEETGDASCFRSVVGEYWDVSALPKDLMELKQFYDQIKEEVAKRESVKEDNSVDTALGVQTGTEEKTETGGTE